MYNVEKSKALADAVLFFPEKKAISPKKCPSFLNIEKEI